MAGKNFNVASEAAKLFLTKPVAGGKTQMESQTVESNIEAADLRFEVGKGMKGMTRSRKYLCLFRPDLYSDIEAKAKELGLSVNELIHQVMSGYITKLKERQ
jgi:hypothetical protein